MPREILGEITHPTVKLGSRSTYTVLVSVVAHAAIAAVAVIVPLMATDVLPAPRTVIGAFAAQPSPPPPPPPASAPPTSVSATPRTETAGVAPTDAPSSIEPETGTTASVIGQPGGVDGGIPEGLGDRLRLMPDIPAPPPPPAARPLPTGGRIKEPTKVRHVPPVYPPIAQQARVEGVVIIEAVIGVDGRVLQARVLRSKPLLEEAALEAVRQWIFTPTLLNGQPVPVIMTVTVNFKLQ